ncbi:MAG TPA: hypothetical protein VH113_00685 [Gemmatimonadales bacterium]|jgi:hypothetical protein|nr:hypothetical protein [Gemmatimonadales bacterium]
MRIGIAVLTLLLGGRSVTAQAGPASVIDSTPRSAWKHAAVHYGKWAVAAGAVAFTALAIEQHRHSNDAWNSLIAICNSDSQLCVIGPNGQYRNYQSEYYYQLAVYYDHRARWRLIAGQVSLLAAAGLFVYDLKGGSNTPPNQPVHPMKLAVTPTADGAALSLHVAF